MPWSLDFKAACSCSWVHWSGDVRSGLQGSTSSLTAVAAVDGCRVAPYVALPTVRLAGLDSSSVNHPAASSTSSAAGSPPSSRPPPPLPAALDPAFAAAALTAAAGLQSAVPFLGPGSPLMAAAAAAAAANSMLQLYGAVPPPPPLASIQYHGLGGLHAALRASGGSQATSGESVCSNNKNNSIAELRMKAKKYAAALGL